MIMAESALGSSKLEKRDSRKNSKKVESRIMQANATYLRK
jgi:hypothetical protein